MAARGKGRTPQVFELRSAAMTLVVVALQTTDMAAIERELTARFADTPDLFSHDPVVIDVSQAEGDPLALDYFRLAELLRRFNMVAAAVRGGSPEQMAAALKVGLGEAPEAVVHAPRAVPHIEAVEAAEPVPEKSSAPVAVPDFAAPPSAEVKSEQLVAAAPTLIIDRPLRSGQQVYARGGDLVVLGTVNFGAELIADGSIHVYGPLRGKAIAGARGNTSARIFSTCMEPELISIAGTYRTTDNPLPAEVIGKPAQIRLDGERLVYEPLT
jgi:septum site-determining protein MinC